MDYIFQKNMNDCLTNILIPVSVDMVNEFLLSLPVLSTVTILVVTLFPEPSVVVIEVGGVKIPPTVSTVICIDFTDPNASETVNSFIRTIAEESSCKCNHRNQTITTKIEF